MGLAEIKNSYRREAERLPNVWALSKTELANIYCDEDEVEHPTAISIDRKNAAFAALMVLYWNKIYKWKIDSASLGLQDEDFVSWLQLGISIAFYYREWRYPNKATVQKGKFIDWKRDEEGNFIPNPLYYVIDENAVDKIINRCCFSIRGREYQLANYDKRRTGSLIDSLDAMIEETDDCAVAYAGAYDNGNMDSGADLLVKEFLKKGKSIEAIIVEYTARTDVFSSKKDHAGEFDLRKLVKNIHNIDEEDIEIFFNKYCIEESPEELYAQIIETSNPKLYSIIHKTFKIIANDPKLLACLK